MAAGMCGSNETPRPAATSPRKVSTSVTAAKNDERVVGDVGKFDSFAIGKPVLGRDGQSKRLDEQLPPGAALIGAVPDGMPRHRDPAFASVCFAFFVGAGIGGVTTNYWGDRAALVVALLVASCVALMSVRLRRERPLPSHFLRHAKDDADHVLEQVV
jgi:hypothetical protein